MAYWLMKTEPGTWSWDDQVKARTTHWDGVRNYQAANNLKAMKKGDKCFFYHSVNEKQVVGVVEVIKEHYPDPSDASGRFVMVDVKAVEPLKTPVTLQQFKEDDRLNHLHLVRQSRLSVMPIDAKSWTLVCKLGGIKG